MQVELSNSNTGIQSYNAYHAMGGQLQGQLKKESAAVNRLGVHQTKSETLG